MEGRRKCSDGREKIGLSKEKNSLGEFDNEQKVFGMKTKMFGEKVFFTETTKFIVRIVQNFGGNLISGEFTSAFNLLVKWN
jgi:hypothetical protein